MENLLDALNSLTKADIQRLNSIYANNLLPSSTRAVLEVLSDSILYGFAESEVQNLSDKEQESLKKRGFGIETNSEGDFLVNMDIDG